MLALLNGITKFLKLFWDQNWFKIFDSKYAVWGSNVGGYNLMPVAETFQYLRTCVRHYVGSTTTLLNCNEALLLICIRGNCETANEQESEQIENRIIWFLPYDKYHFLSILSCASFSPSISHLRHSSVNLY